MTHTIVKVGTTAALLIGVLCILAEPASTCSESHALAVTIITKGTALACFAAVAIAAPKAMNINDPDEED